MRRKRDCSNCYIEIESRRWWLGFLIIVGFLLSGLLFFSVKDVIHKDNKGVIILSLYNIGRFVSSLVMMTCALVSVLLFFGWACGEWTKIEKIRVEKFR